MIEREIIIELICIAAVIAAWVKVWLISKDTDWKVRLVLKESKKNDSPQDPAWIEGKLTEGQKNKMLTALSDHTIREFFCHTDHPGRKHLATHKRRNHGSNHRAK